MFLQEKAKGNPKCLSMTTNKYWSVVDDKGPLKSTFKCSMNWVAVIGVPLLLWINAGLISVHTLPPETTCLTSVVENGKSLVLTKCKNLVTLYEGGKVDYGVFPRYVEEMEALNARVSVFGPSFRWPGRYLTTYENEASSMRHCWILSFFIFVRRLLPNIKETDRWSVTRVNVFLDNKRDHFLTAWVITVASFSKAG